MLVMAGAGLLIVLALCMAALYKWITFLNGKMTRYGMHVHQMLKTDESDAENENKRDLLWKRKMKKYVRECWSYK